MIEVLKQISPTVAPCAPMPRPHITDPSANTSTPVAPSGTTVDRSLAVAALSAIGVSDGRFEELLQRVRRKLDKPFIVDSR